MKKKNMFNLVFWDCSWLKIKWLTMIFSHISLSHSACWAFVALGSWWTRSENEIEMSLQCSLWAVESQPKGLKPASAVNKEKKPLCKCRCVIEWKIFFRKKIFRKKYYLEKYSLLSHLVCLDCGNRKIPRTNYVILISAMGNSVFPSESWKTLLLSNKYIFINKCMYLIITVKRSPKHIKFVVRLQERESLFLFFGIRFFRFNLNPKGFFLHTLVSPHRHRPARGCGWGLQPMEHKFFLKPFTCWLAAFPLAAQPFTHLLASIVVAVPVHWMHNFLPVTQNNPQWLVMC